MSEMQGKISWDDSEMNAKVSKWDAMLNAQTEKAHNIGAKLDYLLLRSRSITSMIFKMFKESAALQVTESILAISMTAVSMHRTMLQAGAAFTEGHITEGFMLAGIAASMGANMAQMQLVKIQAEQNKQNLNDIRKFMEAY